MFSLMLNFLKNTLLFEHEIFYHPQIFFYSYMSSIVEEFKINMFYFQSKQLHKYTIHDSATCENTVAKM